MNGLSIEELKSKLELDELPPPPSEVHKVDGAKLPDNLEPLTDDDMWWLSLPEFLRRITDEPIGEDRSKQTWHLANLALETGLTDLQAGRLMTRHRATVDKGRFSELASKAIGKARERHPHPGTECVDANCAHTPRWQKKAERDGGGDGGSEQPKKGRGDSQATVLARLALDRYRFAQADDGRAFAVPLDGPLIARPLDGTRSSLRSELAAIYFDQTGNAAGKSALADALGVLEGRAQMAEREVLSLRTGNVDDAIVIDLGTPTGECIRVTAGRVELLPRSPIVFRRTELTMPLPTPVQGGDIGRLAELVNVSDDDLPLLIGWCLSTLFDIARPILLLTGEQGTGKSRAAKTVTQLFDPSPAPLRAGPRDVDSWVIAAAGSQVVALDNLSSVADWLSDALCRAATGEGLVRRALYTDDGLSVLNIRRSVILTSIDAGALRGDLGERLVPVELERITPDRRKTDAELDKAFREAAPVILGALLDLAAAVLDVLPTVTVDDLPRMADFGRLLGALDKVKGWHSLDTYRTAVDQVAADVIAGDPLAAAVLEYMETRPTWTGTATELLQRLSAHKPEGAAWPKSAKTLSGALTRLAPALRGQGIDLRKTKANGTRSLTLEVRDARDARDAPPHLRVRTKEGDDPPRVAPESASDHNPSGSAASPASLASLGTDSGEVFG